MNANTAIKIGITERGDAGRDLSWVEKLNAMTGTILITKIITNAFIEKVLAAHRAGHKLIVHCTCTGWGESAFEPNVPSYQKQISQLKKLIDSGFPANHCVLRIDPIFPTEKGLQRIHEMLDWFSIAFQPYTDQIRYRMSVYDEYNHVKERLKQAGFQPMYERFYASYAQMHDVGELLSKYPYVFATCAEDKLAQEFPNTFIQAGCVSYDDFDIMGIPRQEFRTNGQQRTGCHCLTCKTELLTCKHRCPNQCIYCYWRD